MGPAIHDLVGVLQGEREAASEAQQKEIALDAHPRVRDLIWISSD